MTQDYPATDVANNSTLVNSWWLPVRGHPDYLVSASGQVASYCGRKEHKILRPGRHRDGYHFVCLRRPAKVWLIHRLVALTWLGDPPEDMLKPVVDHINLDPSDNRVENLRWLPSAVNVARHMIRRFPDSEAWQGHIASPSLRVN